MRGRVPSFLALQSAERASMGALTLLFTLSLLPGCKDKSSEEAPADPAAAPDRDKAEGRISAPPPAAEIADLAERILGKGPWEDAAQAQVTLSCATKSSENDNCSAPSVFAIDGQEFHRFPEHAGLKEIKLQFLSHELRNALLLSYLVKNTDAGSWRLEQRVFAAQGGRVLPVWEASAPDRPPPPDKQQSKQQDKRSESDGNHFLSWQSVCDDQKAQFELSQLRWNGIEVVVDKVERWSQAHPGCESKPEK